MLCDPGDVVLIEDRSYPTAMETLKPMKLSAFPVRIDHGGIVVEELASVLEKWEGKLPKCIYTMPTGQNPTGVTMSLERRKSFYAVCQKYDIIIIEDDPYYFLQLGEPSAKGPDGEFSASNLLKGLIPSLLSLDTDGRVIRFDSFSKVMVPGSRTGSITSNKTFVERIIRHNEVNIQSASGFSQLILYSILSRWTHDGYLQWLEKIRLEYTRRRDALMAAFDKYLPKDLCSWNRPNSGMFLWIDVNLAAFPRPAGLTDEEFAADFEARAFEKAVENNVLLAKGQWFIVPPSSMLKHAGFRATYAAASDEQMILAAQRLAQTLRDLLV
ncbi:unnamed protein product [Kuraishia capsulata CBS 1993]|uniref:Aminotransferase class I/classII large domain-containing protein n=1 Tax=Kuraishia capsulata CBS 1993 TaxID=1382522 RepID=W6MHR3_9ASCO|nr:uncharacterized protein KUCA_T00001835001 [Kuraishia capsulata CBS 1993]CDK25864.1 unnamed protein product [Kuraishia capsulata CBS 1993]